MIIKSDILTALHILQLYNKHISVLAPPEAEEPNQPPKGILWKKKQKVNLTRILGKPGAKRRTVKLLA